jgi:hypothetical protein
MRQLCAKNYSETVLHCHFYYDIQTLSLQRTDIPLNHRRFMYRKDAKLWGFCAKPTIFAHLSGMAHRGDLCFFPGTEFEIFCLEF